ncbi:cell division protein FtsQ [Paucidesulfovibrio gracilis DSM 16080]|uniref:Cell division protein FtsQ n=1 Tax=Paucidesulfovibrio gracilis DSM 16080 TaxID=1121449 RepID=A0A1T4W5G9_9BACT|nr:FtsQ-type POTRA domain-containing protein [Paucidesulfovibrio gracilis]SKA72389.1 cell division protein FtsQ [Paucidesulfovibrio gracilis DSM 16080]
MSRRLSNPSYLNSGKQSLRRRSNRYRGSDGFSHGSPALRRFVLMLGLGTALVALMGVLYFGYRLGTTTEFFALDKIEVLGNKRLSYGEVLDAGRVRLGQNSLALNLSRVEALLSKNPWVKNVSVRRDIPRKLIIQVEERDPAYWIRRGGSLYYADENGELITSVSPADFRSLPVLEADAEMRERLTELPDMIRALDNGAMPLSRDALAWVRLSGAGQAQMFLDNANLTLTFALEDWRSELRHVRLVAQDMRRRGEMNRVRRITASGGKVWVDRTH